MANKKGLTVSSTNISKPLTIKNQIQSIKPINSISNQKFTIYHDDEDDEEIQKESNFNWKTLGTQNERKKENKSIIIYIYS